LARSLARYNHQIEFVYLSLATEEVEALAAQRELAQDTHHCPHGRPTSLLFTRQDLDRQFRRT
jgi:DNA mismatch repair protein MutL